MRWPAEASSLLLPVLRRPLLSLGGTDSCMSEGPDAVDIGQACAVVQAVTDALRAGIAPMSSARRRTEEAARVMENAMVLKQEELESAQRSNAQLNSLVRTGNGQQGRCMMANETRMSCSRSS